MAQYKNNFEESVCFWTKGDLIDLAQEYYLFESAHDMQNFSCMLDFDQLCDFIVFLFCGDWSRNITIIDEEAQNDDRVKRLFDYNDQHAGAK